MKALLSFFQLNFLPISSHFGLLLLRLSFGISMLALHGAGKIAKFSTLSSGFPDPLGVGSTVSLVLAIFAEVLGSILIVVGLCTRFAALAGLIAMAVAFFGVHQGALSGPNSGELALMYLFAYLVLYIAGPGRFSVDAKLGGKIA